jgi:putative endonuclease
MKPATTPTRAARGAQAHRRGDHAERAVQTVLEADGWTTLGRRLRTPVGEVDLVARKADVLSFIEVKARAELSDAAWSISPRQQRRVLLAAEALLAVHPEWATPSIRFDAILVDAAGRMRRVTDAFRAE